METPSPTLPEAPVVTDFDAPVAFLCIRSTAHENDLVLG